MKQQDLLDIGSSERRKALQPMAKAALDLAEWAAEGKSDYFLAGQMAMLVRKFSQIAAPSPIYPDLAAVLDFLGMSIQSAVGRACKPQRPPAVNAVEAPHETVLEPESSGASAATNGR